MNRKWYRLLVGCKLILEEIPIGRLFPFLYARRRFASRDVTTLRFFLQNKLRSKVKVKGQGQRSRSVKIYIIPIIPYYRASYYFAKNFSESILVTAVCLFVCYFAKSSIFAKYIGHHGFRVSVSACMFFPFVRLQRLYRPHGLSDRPDSFGSRYIQFMGPCSIFTFLYRVKFKVKVTTFVKI